MATLKHRLVVIGDSLSQGFMSGAISQTRISFPAMIAEAMGLEVGTSFAVPNFQGEGGLPLNIERILNELARFYGTAVNWWELPAMLIRLRSILDDIEDYWERGDGSRPYPHRGVYHNLAVWGFEVRDAYTVTEGVCRRAIPKPGDDSVNQIPEMPMYRTARRVLNPTFANDAMEWTQVDAARELARDGGIENLVVFLGANNALGPVAALKIRYSEDRDLYRLPHERYCNLYLPEHFAQLYEELAEAVAGIRARNVFLGTVPHVTIPPVTRGTPPPPKGTLVPGVSPRRRYYEFYTRPWIWDDDFDKDRHPHLTREQAIQIDSFIDCYNKAIRSIAERRGWHVFDACAVLDELAYRSQNGEPTYQFPAGLVAALKEHEPLRYLVVKTPEGGERVALDTRFFMAAPPRSKGQPARIEKGGLFSLDGIHPTTIGYSILAHTLLETMAKVGAVPQGTQLNWDRIVRRDSLVNSPPIMLCQLRDTLTFLDRRGLLSGVLKLFSRAKGDD